MTLRFLTAGESHGPELVVVIEGMPAGVPVSADAIDTQLRRRQGGYGRGARSSKIERDRADVVGGLAEGLTTGAPIALRIVNRDFANQPGTPRPLTTPRPGHADLAGRVKYGLDFRTVRERASARETAARVSAGTVAAQLVSAFGGRLGSFVTAIGSVEHHVPIEFLDADALHALAEAAEKNDTRCPDPTTAEAMRAEIDRAKASGETLGGTFVVFASGVPAGLGSYAQWDRKLDGRLAGAGASIPAIKGVEIGPAFDVAARDGSKVQDPIRTDGRGLRRGSNHAGGLEGGVTNGQPVVLRAAMKPLSSVRAPLESVDFERGEAADPPHVRSDVCAVAPASVVAEAMVAWVLAEALVARFGQDRLDAMLVAFDSVRDAGAPRGAIQR